ncbi:MAG TPA: methyltransferase domain-containing protein, partial [Thermomicrobiales bacterium]|nr:methyltransferase domain-containing protein [Thermomicrobiales bacterium]
MGVEQMNPAETYETYMGPALFAPCADRLIAAAKPSPGLRVLDLACGTGIVARRIAPLLDGGGTVTGLDISPGMLTVARDRSVSEGVSIEWVEGRAEHLPFVDGAFDLVACQFGLMFFQDRQAALAEILRVLSPGGMVAIHVFQEIERHPFYLRLDNVIKARFGMSGVGDIFSLGNRDRLHDLVAAEGFGRIDIKPFELVARFPDPNSFLTGEIAVDTAAIPEMQDFNSDARSEMVASIASGMRDALREVTDGDHVAMQ